jgi:hypothetical protein
MTRSPVVVDDVVEFHRDHALDQTISIHLAADLGGGEGAAEQFVVHRGLHRAVRGT